LPSPIGECMRQRLLKWLVCTECRGKLVVQPDVVTAEDIVEGTLICRCGRHFPIIGSVARMLPEKHFAELAAKYPDFFGRHSELYGAVRTDGRDDATEKNRATMDRFGYEWTRFSDYGCDNFTPFVAPLPQDFFRRKLGLDVGCGNGRHAREAMQRGAEIVAVDLSDAVDTAQKNNAGNERVHVVQADTYELPFESATFDFIYSLGVVQHLPEPERGYRNLVQFLKNGGALFVWVYAYSFRKVALECLRAISQRLSNENIRRMAFLCNLLDYGMFVNAYKLARHWGRLGKLVQRHAPLRIKEYARHGYAVSYVDWFDRLAAPTTNYYREHEVQGWLQRSGLSNTRLLPEGDSWWWLYGERTLRS